MQPKEAEFLFNFKLNCILSMTEMGRIGFMKTVNFSPWL